VIEKGPLPQNVLDEIRAIQKGFAAWGVLSPTTLAAGVAAAWIPHQVRDDGLSCREG
jgi:hypothetical protein